MSECDAVTLQMAELLTESLTPEARETAHRHIETCEACGAEWRRARQTWAMMEDLPPVEVPPSVREAFLAHVDRLRGEAKVVRFVPRRVASWMGKAAAVAILVGGSFYAGDRRNVATTAPLLTPTPATVEEITPAAYAIAENRVLDASEMNPDIQGRPEIRNVQFVQPGTGGDDQVSVSFDVTSHVTIKGKPSDKALVKLLSYVLQNQDHPTLSRSRTLEWVRSTYAETGAVTDPEIVRALANVLKNDSHEGVRIKAVETLQSIPPALAAEARTALIDALQNDPNPAVRIKAIDALAKLAHTGDHFDPASLEMLRKKAGQIDENTYVRVKAAEALGQINL